jgi:hypothetical protein
VRTHFGTPKNKTDSDAIEEEEVAAEEIKETESPLERCEWLGDQSQRQKSLNSKDANMKNTANASPETQRHTE